MQQGYIPGQPKSYQQHVPQVQQMPHAPVPPPYQHQQIPQPPSMPIYQHQAAQASQPRQKTRRCLLLLITAVLGLAYVVYLIVYFSGISTAIPADDVAGFTQLAAAFALRLVLPHIIAAGLAALLLLAGWWVNNKWLALAGALAYLAAILLFSLYWIFALPLMILSLAAFTVMLLRGRKTQ